MDKAHPHNINLFGPTLTAYFPVKKFPIRKPNPIIAKRYPWTAGVNLKYPSEITGAPVRKLK